MRKLTTIRFASPSANRLSAVCMWVVCLGSLMILARDVAWSQTTQQPVNAWQYAQAQNRTLTPAMQYFGRGRVSPSLPPLQEARNLTGAPQGVQIARGKPFQDTVRPPTLSPYLSLDRFESETGLPNYHAFVRPQIQQQQENRQQARKASRLKQQTRMASAPAAVSRSTHRRPESTGQGSQFLNVGNYFPGLRK